MAIALGGSAWAQSPAGIDWQPDFDKALARAKKENKPVLVAFILRGESANEEICDDHFHDEKIVKFTRRFVCLLALSDYGTEGHSRENSGRLIKELEGRVTEKQLRAVEQDARTDLLESDLVSAPQFIFLEPDGKSVLLRHVWMLSKTSLLTKMKKAYHYFDASFAAPEEVQAEKKDVSDLLARCNHKNLVTRRDALRELSSKDHPDVVAFLIKQTGRTVDQQRRLEAIRAMAVSGAAKFLPRLHAMLKRETSFQIRSNIANTLGSIGLVESGTHLLKAIKKERKENVRSLLVRALACCSPQGKATKKLFSKLLKSGSDVDKQTVCYVMASQPADPDLDKLVMKLVKSSKAAIRAAAYLVVGKHQLVGARKALKARLKAEKMTSRNACAWALAQIGEADTGAKDPTGDVSSALPRAAY